MMIPGLVARESMRDLDGEIQLAYWSSGEPNNDGGNDHCAESFDEQSYFWNDMEWWRRNYFICVSQY